MKWTKEETELLYKYYKDTTTREMQEMIPERSLRGIQGKARNSGLRKSAEVKSRTSREGTIKYNADNDPYPEMTEEYLVEEYINKRLSSTKIGEYFGCTNGPVLKRLARFGIDRRTSPSDYTVEERVEMFGMKLESHPLWKGGKTPLSGLVRNRVAYLSDEVVKEAWYTCADCNNPNGTKNAHHIRPFSDIIDEIIVENGNLSVQDADERMELVRICGEDARVLDKDNLVTLCIPCHTNRHSDNPVPVKNHEVVIAEEREYIDFNHFDMSVKAMCRELNIRHAKLNAYMDYMGYSYAYSNPKWLRNRLEETYPTEIAYEFNSAQLRCKPADIRRRSEAFGFRRRGDGIVVDYTPEEEMEAIS